MISIRYPGMQQGYDPEAVDRSFDRAFTYGRERRDEKQGLAAFDKYITGLSGGQSAQQPMSLAALAPQGYPGTVERAPLPDIASARVAQAFGDERSPFPGAAPKQDRITPQDAQQASTPPQGALEAYIRHAAKKRGIDPEIAVKVAMSEGGVSDPYRQSDVVKNGVREQSYGPFQLYMNGGLGNEALAAGIDPRKDWQGGIDFALDKAAQGGWGPWYGAEKVGVTGRMGIGGGQAPMQVADASGGMQMPQGAPQGGSGLPDRETMLALFKSPQTRPLAIQLAQSAQAAKQGDPEAALRLEKLALEVQKMRNPQASPDDFKVVNNRLVRVGPGGVEDVTPPTPNGVPTTNFDDVSGLRKEIHQLPSYKNLAQAAPIYRSMSETAGRNSRASDLNLVYGLGKIMDPTSVVREGEMVMVKNTASLPDWLQGAINSLNGGAALSPETRQAILTEAYGRVKGYSDEFDRDAQQYRGIVQRNGINPADVVPEFGQLEPWRAPEDTQPAPEGVDPGLWQFMTPEERRLWQ